MPDQETIERAREDAKKGKSPSTQAGEFVHEEIEHVREGKHGARSTKQAIAIGLSKARRAGVKLPRPKVDHLGGDPQESPPRRESCETAAQSGEKTLARDLEGAQTRKQAIRVVGRTITTGSPRRLAPVQDESLAQARPMTASSGRDGYSFRGAVSISFCPVVTRTRPAHWRREILSSFLVAQAWAFTYRLGTGKFYKEAIFARDKIQNPSGGNLIHGPSRWFSTTGRRAPRLLLSARSQTTWI